MEDTKLHIQLDAFLKKADAKLALGRPSNEWVYGDYTSLYVRRTRRWINGGTVDTLDIANISVDEEFHGMGVFSSLMKYLESRDYNIYVESVLNDRLGSHLMNSGFECVHGSPAAPCYLRMSSMGNDPDAVSMCE